MAATGRAGKAGTAWQARSLIAILQHRHRLVKKGGEASLSEYRPDDFSDAGNAELFRTSWQGLLTWTDSMGWLRYDGRRWQQDDHEATNAAVTLTDAMLNDARAEYADGEG